MSCAGTVEALRLRIKGAPRLDARAGVEPRRSTTVSRGSTVTIGSRSREKS